MKNVSKDQAILKMLQEGKSYTDIVAALHVSPTRIIVLKKRIALNGNDDLLKVNEKADISDNTRHQEKEYFASRYDLMIRLKSLSDGKFRENSLNGIKENKSGEIRIKLDLYLVERISFREWTLLKTGEL